MSYDFALEQICTHEVKLETTPFAAGTFDTLSFAQPPSNSQVALYADDLVVPPGGLYAVPTLPFSKSEPYRIVAGVSDLLYLQIGSNTPRIVQLITGNNVLAKDLAHDLSLKIPELNIVASGGQVLFQGLDSGPFATPFCFADPRWTDKTGSLPSTARILSGYKQVGIVPGRKVISRKIYPSWDLVRDPISPVAGVVQLQFSEPIRNASPLFQVSYFTDASSCRRCHGTRIEFDYSISGGTYDTVSDADLLSQEFDKFLFTRSNSHFKWPWLGSKLIDRIGGKNVSSGVSASALITLDISSAFKTYQNIKSQQDQHFPYQQVSDAEFPFALGGITVQVPPDQPDIAIVVTSVQSRSRDPVTLKRVVGNPNPFLLAAGDQSLFLKG